MATSEYFSAGSPGHVGHLLSDYLEGDLPHATRESVEEHLAGCGRCAHDLATLRFTVQVIRQVPSSPVPRSFALPAGSVRRSSLLGWLRWTTGALAALFVALVAAQLVLPAPSPTTSVAYQRTRPAAAPTTAPQAAAAVASNAQPARPPQAAAARSAPVNRASGGGTSGSEPPGAAGPSQQQARAVAPAPTLSPYPYPTVGPRPTAAPGYPYPGANQPAVTSLPSSPAAAGAYPTAITARPAAVSTEPSPTPAPRPAPTRSFTMTPALFIIAALLVLSGAALVLLGRRQG